MNFTISNYNCVVHQSQIMKSQITHTEKFKLKVFPGVAALYSVILDHIMSFDFHLILI